MAQERPLDKEKMARLKSGLDAIGATAGEVYLVSHQMVIKWANGSSDEDVKKLPVEIMNLIEVARWCGEIQGTVTGLKMMVIPRDPFVAIAMAPLTAALGEDE